MNRRFHPAHLLRSAARHWDLTVPLTVLAVGAAVCVAAILRRDQGHLVYIIDDAYIHMAIAKHLVLHGIWGTSYNAFSSCASSLLWPLMLAGSYLVTGVNEFAPLAFNLLVGATLLAALHHIFHREGHPPWAILAVLMLAMALAPYSIHVFMGMEHLAHFLLCIVFIDAAAGLLERPSMTWRDGRGLLVLAALLMTIRYESGLLLAVAWLFFVARRRVGFAMLLAAAGGLPLILFGLFSLAKGWEFLPNSVLIKANLFGYMAGLGRKMAPLNMLEARLIVMRQLYGFFLTSVFIVIFGMGLTRNLWQRPILMNLFYLGAFLPIAFMTSLDFGPMFRYQSVVVMVGVFVNVLSMPWNVERFKALRRADPAGFRRRAGPWLALMVLVTGLLVQNTCGILGRNYDLTRDLPRASQNIYNQQYQMGHFFARYYAGQAVAVNDIGAVSYFADIDCVDLFGLATMETAKAKRDGLYNPKTLLELGRKKNIRVAIIYDQWIKSARPVEWIRVGVWVIPKNVICGDASVSIYAVDPAEREPLIEHLREFGAGMPACVAQRGEYSGVPVDAPLEFADESASSASAGDRKATVGL